MGSNHLLDTASLDQKEILALFARADLHHENNRTAERKSASLRGRTLINLFFESSTRTRSSFEIAGKRLGADVINVSPSGSSVSKGETLLDTARNLERMATDAVVLRHERSGSAAFLAARLRASVVNAGDGSHEHPTQALLDAYTLRRVWGDLSGRTVVFVGDILHSRVARSNAHLLPKLGARVRFSGPKTLMPPPRFFEELGAAWSYNLDEALESADAIVALRIQMERFGGGRLSTAREYSRSFGINPARLSLAKPDAVVLHPGPINRGVELDTALADSSRSLVLDQVEAGVSVRMAVLERAVLGGLPS